MFIHIFIHLRIHTNPHWMTIIWTDVRLAGLRSFLLFGLRLTSNALVCNSLFKWNYTLRSSVITQFTGWNLTSFNQWFLNGCDYQLIRTYIIMGPSIISLMIQCCVFVVEYNDNAVDNQHVCKHCFKLTDYKCRYFS